MSFFSPKSLKNLIFRHEIAILFLVAVMGLIGGVSAFFWQQNSAESVRINTMFYLTEQIRGELYAQIQEMIRARILEDSHALEIYPEYSRSISERFNELRRRSISRKEDLAIQELNLAFWLFLYHVHKAYKYIFLTKKLITNLLTFQLKISKEYSFGF